MWMLITFCKPNRSTLNISVTKHYIPAKSNNWEVHHPSPLVGNVLLIVVQINIQSGVVAGANNSDLQTSPACTITVRDQPIAKKHPREKGYIMLVSAAVKITSISSERLVF